MARKPVEYKNANADGSIKNTHSVEPTKPIPSQNDKYVGGNTFRKPDGTVHEKHGTFVSPSGKVSEIADDGTVTTIKSKDENQIGNVYKDRKLVGKFQ